MKQGKFNRERHVWAILTVLFLLVLLPVTVTASPQDNIETGTTDPDKISTGEENTKLTGPVKKDKSGIPKTAVEDSKPDLPETVSFFQTLMALSFVLGLIFLSAYLYKKFTGMKTGNIRSNRVAITPVGSLPLGEKKFLSVVEIEGQYYFIGITPNNITMLSRLDLELPDEPEDNEQGDFGSIFRKAKNLLQQGGPRQGPGPVKMNINDLDR